MITDTSDLPDLNLREQITRIDRAIAETNKFSAEQSKLAAEAAKLQWDRWLAPLAVALSSVSGGVVVAVINHLWK